ncbi:Unconventional myosin-IXb [Bagarius yarrelli]|uniref:Unconventional myosin-IXb n=1 Tax=Bagarius yarrelli TaxID=175774 RepID=A0A556TSD4_BAGYA|nr:Unconventional myosin-IXb [Bagarius yarrelli]
MSVTDGEGTACQSGRAYILQIYPRLSLETASCCIVRVHKEATAATVIQDATVTLGLDAAKHYVLAEVKESGGEEWILEATDLPVHRVLLWPRKAQEEHAQSEGFYFILQERNHDGSICYAHLPTVCREQDAQQLVARGFLPQCHEDFNDLCNLPILNEDTILANLRSRFQKKKIYTYAGSILVAINPFKFLPIYNPKYVKMYENHQLGKLEPHIFAIADVSYYAMLRKRINQCIVISGESGSGKTQSTNFLIHCLTALSQKGYASGVERTILGAGPVLEAFGNAKTAHNNNSSRFGKFIQVNYLESGVVRGAVVEKYLLEKSRLVSREKNERIFSVLSAILYLGNVTYSKKATGRDEGLEVGPPEVLSELSELLKVIAKHSVQRLLIDFTLVSSTHKNTKPKTTFCVVRPVSRVPLGELQRSNMPIEKMYRDMHAQIISSIKDLQLDGEDPRKLLQSWGRLRYPRHPLQKHKNTKHKQLIPKTSLSKLIETLAKAEPFFIRCLRSNAEKHSWRSCRKRRCQAATLIQAAWRGYKQRANYQNRRASVTKIQALVRGHSARRRYNSLKEERKKREEKEAQRRKEEEEKAARRAQEAAEVARKAQEEAEKAARQEREAAEAARRAQEEEKRQREADEAAKKEKDAEEKAKNLPEQKTKAEGPELQLSNQAVIEIDRRKESSVLAPHLVEKGCQQTGAGPQQNAEPHDSQVGHKNSLAVLETHNKDIKTLYETNKNFNVPFPIHSSQNTASAAPSITCTVPSEPSPGVSAENNGKSPQMGSPTTNTIQPDPCRSKAPQMGKLPASRSQEKRELRRQRGLEHSQRESVRAAAANKDESCKELDPYTVVPQKKETSEKDTEKEEKGKDKIVTRQVRPTTLPLELPPSNEPKHTPKTKDGSSQEKSNIQAECVLKEPRHQEDQRTRILKTSHSFDDVLDLKISEVSAGLQDNVHCRKCPRRRHRLEFVRNCLNVKSAEMEDVELWTFSHTVPVQKPHIGYKGLMRGYQNKVISLAGEQQKGEVQLVVNLFQSVLDGFIRGEIKREEAEPVKMESPLDHVFSNFQVNIMQSCDQCSSYIWVMEKAYMCSYCKLVCHKKCLSKIVTDCNSFCSKKGEEDSGAQHFGVRVCRLITDKIPVPIVLELMLEHVEMNGLYTEGIYRKSGSANRMKELRQLLEADPNAVCLEDYPIHTVTGLVKQWLRELPEPLMTFNHYSDFLHAVELPEKQEQLQAIYRIIEELPTAHFQTLERLVFHLVRVSREKKSNRMTSNSLAIVFAPCILRGPDSADPLLSMKDVAKTTMCIEMLINEQMRRYIERLEEIEQLEYAETLAKNQLKLKRSNTSWPLPLRFTSPYKGVAVKEKPSDLCAVPENEPLDSDTEAERNLVERLKSIKQEKMRAVLQTQKLFSSPTSPMLTSTSKNFCPPSTASPPSRNQLQRRYPIIPCTLRLPPGVFTLVQRRPRPGRRKDSIQSLFFGSGTDLNALSSSLSSSSVPQNLHISSRRFSDPDIAHSEDGV